MWQQPQSIRWLPSLLTLMLLAACSQATPPSQMSEPSPIAAQSETVPATSPLLSAPAPASQLPATTEPMGQTTPLIAPAPVSKAASKAQASIAAKPSANPLSERTPTFQTTPRMAGFSPDSNYFIYLESSRDTGAGVPKSALQLVNVTSNRCVENGCIETRYGEQEAGTKTTDAETALLQQTWKVRQDLNLTPPVAGTDLPILSRSRAADGSETVTVQPAASQPLQLHLRQKTAPDKAAMQLEVNYNGQQRSLDSLSNFRTNVLGYAVRQVTLSPDGKQVAVLITTIKPTFEGTLGTTLVQGFAL